MPDYGIFYIGHIVEPFLFYCLTQSYFLPILFATVWELAEYSMFMITGNYSILYLEEGEGSMEEPIDILLWDIGGAVLATYVAYTLYKYYQIMEIPIIQLDFYNSKTWWFLFLYVFRSLIILSPFSSLGWECSNSTGNLLEDICPPAGEYFPFPPGLPVIALVDIWFVFYMFSGEDRKKEKYIALAGTSLVILTACQRFMPPIELMMWILFGISVLFSIYWIVLFIQECVRRRKKRTDYNPIGNAAL